MSKRKRRYFSPEEKVMILKKHLVEKIPVSDICDTHRIQPVVFYKWQKQFFENGAQSFQKAKNGREKKLEKQISHLSEKLHKKNEVLSELMEEHVALKKNLGES